MRDGEGAYKQVVRYHHVGAGRGDFEPVTPQPATQTQLMWVPLGILLLFFVLSAPRLGWATGGCVLFVLLSFSPQTPEAWGSKQVPEQVPVGQQVLRQVPEEELGAVRSRW